MLYAIIKTNCENGIENVKNELISLHDNRNDAHGALSLLFDDANYIYKYRANGLVKVIRRGFFSNVTSHYYTILDLNED